MSAALFPRVNHSLFHGFEVRVLFVVLVFFSALFGAVLALDLLHSGAAGEFDRRFLLLLREPGNPADLRGGAWLEELGRDFTALGGFPVLTLFTLVVVVFLVFAHHKMLAMIFLVATVLALFLSSGLKAALDRARPDLVPHATQVHTASFPSGHAMHAAANYFTLGGLFARAQKRRRIRLLVVSVAALITLLVGISRVYLGVHWPTDVLGGWALGSACALATLILARVLTAPSFAAEKAFADDRV